MGEITGEVKKAAGIPREKRMKWLEYLGWRGRNGWSTWRGESVAAAVHGDMSMKRLEYLRRRVRSD